MRTIKQDELATKIEFAFYNGVDLDRIFMDNIQVFGKFLSDFCMTLGTDGADMYGYKDGSFGSITKMPVSTHIKEMTVNANGTFLLKLGTNGDEKLDGKDTVEVKAKGVEYRAIYRWDSVLKAYKSTDQAAADMYISMYKGTYIPPGNSTPAPAMTKACFIVARLPKEILKYSFQKLRTGIQP